MTFELHINSDVYVYDLPESPQTGDQIEVEVGGKTGIAEVVQRRWVQLVEGYELECYANWRRVPGGR